jgi:hypothetical protein
MVSISFQDEHLHVHVSERESEGKALRIAHAVNERLTPVLCPQTLVVEGSRVPHDFVHNLRDLDGVGRGTWAAGLEGAGLGVGYVASVVWAVEVLAVPAPDRACLSFDIRVDGLSIVPLTSGRLWSSGCRLHKVQGAKLSCRFPYKAPRQRG